MATDPDGAGVHPSRHNGLRATIDDGGVALGVLDDTYTRYRHSASVRTTWPKRSSKDTSYSTSGA